MRMHGILSCSRLGAASLSHSQCARPLAPLSVVSCPPQPERPALAEPWSLRPPDSPLPIPAVLALSPSHAAYEPHRPTAAPHRARPPRPPSQCRAHIRRALNKSHDIVARAHAIHRAHARATIHAGTTPHRAHARARHAAGASSACVVTAASAAASSPSAARRRRAASRHGGGSTRAPTWHAYSRNSASTSAARGLSRRRSGRASRRRLQPRASCSGERSAWAWRRPRRARARACSGSEWSRESTTSRLTTSCIKEGASSSMMQRTASSASPPTRYSRTSSLTECLSVAMSASAAAPHTLRRFSPK
mmetsp:Transcript_32352/g.88668  ORF Transcript_32352/g.88668 Transcript_32352/m.88668 type:complete len:306 (-) Transcript_32352:534-1451(-)